MTRYARDPATAGIDFQVEDDIITMYLNKLVSNQLCTIFSTRLSQDWL